MAYFAAAILREGGPIALLRALGAQARFAVSGWRERRRLPMGSAQQWMPWIRRHGLRDLLALKARVGPDISNSHDRAAPRSSPASAAGAAAIHLPPANERQGSSLPARAALVGLTALFAIVTIAWLRLDTSPPPWDQAEYLVRSQILYDALENQGGGAFLAAFSTVMRVKAPLITVQPFPFYLLWGEAADTAAHVNVVWIVVACGYLYRLGRLIAGTGAAVLAVLLLNTFPIVAGMSRQFLVEYGLMTLVVMWMYHLARWSSAEGHRHAWVLGALLGFGLLQKVTFPLYAAAPFAVVLQQRLASDRGRRGLIGDLLRIGVLGAAIAALWYGRNLASVLRFVVRSGYSEAASEYGTGPVFSVPAVASYWMNLISFGTSAYYAFLLLVAAAWVSHGFLVRSNRSGLQGSQLCLVLAWLLVPWAILTFGVNKDVRFIMPSLPALALLLGAVGAAAAPTPRRQLVLALLAAVGLANYCYYSLAGRTFLPEVRLGDLRVLSRSLGSASPPLRQRWPNTEVMRWLADDAKTLGAPAVTVLFSHPRISPHNLWYAAVQERLPVRFLESFGGDRTAAARANEIRARTDYVLLKSGNLGPAIASNASNAEVMRLLAAEGMPFAPVAWFPLPDESTLTVLGRKGRALPAEHFGVGMRSGVRRAALFAPGIALVDHDLVLERTGATLSMAWLCTASLEEDYRIFVHVLDGQGRIVAQADHYPAGGRHPTSRWQVGELVEERIAIDRRLSPQERVYVGWYLLAGLRQLPVVGGGAAEAGEPNGVRVH